MSEMHDVFMITAFLFASKSHCVSHHVGAVIVKNNRIIVTGYNGTPEGLPNCDEVFDPNNFDRESHHHWSKDNEIHAEMNATQFASKYGVDTDGADMYVTISPCNDCLKNIIPAGIKNLYYLYLYDKVDFNPALLKRINVMEVPEAAEIKKFIEKNDLLYVAKQKNKEELLKKLSELKTDNHQPFFNVEFLKKMLWKTKEK
jgi:dCMP deaminase